MTFLGNGQQRFVVPVALTVETVTDEQEEAAAKRRRWLTWTLAGGVVFVALVFAVAVVVNHRRSQENPPIVVEPPVPPEPPEPDVDHWWDDIPDTHLTASVTALKKAAGDNRPIFERVEGTKKADRREGYEQLAAKLPELARKPDIRQPLGQFVTECCVYEDSEFNIEPLLRGLAHQFPAEDRPFPPGDKGEEVECASFWLRVVCDAITHKAAPPDRGRSLTSEVGKVFGFAFDPDLPPNEFKDKAEKTLAEQCYHNLLPTAEKSVEQTLAIREVLLAKFPQHLKPEFREEPDLKLFQVLEKRDSSALSALQIAQRWTGENSGTVREALVNMLQSRLPMLKRDEMKEVLPLLNHKDTEIVLVVLRFVQVRKDEAAVVAVEVAGLLTHSATEVREAALKALGSIGTAGDKALPKLSQQLLDRWPLEKDLAVRQALIKLLRSRLTRLKPEQMKQLLPLLNHKDTEIVLVGLKVVQDRKDEASVVADKVAELLKHDAGEVREAARNALLAMGPAVEKALPTFSLRLRRLLHGKDKDIVVVGLKVVQDRKEKAADLAQDVVSLTTDPDASVPRCSSEDPASSRLRRR